MEVSKDHPTPYPVNTGRVRQRYAIRSSHKDKEDKASNEITITPKREKRMTSVSKSVSTLDLSVKDKPVKPSRRLSVPSKYATPVSRSEKKVPSSAPSSIISENKSTSKPSFVLGPSSVETKGKPTAKTLSVSFQGSLTKSQGKANGVNKDTMSTPTVSATPQEIPKTGQRRKFSTLMSSSYWLAQVKLAESAGRHAISLGFFRLALESTAEPLQRVRDELKSYAKKHNLLELGQVAKEVLLNYGVLEEVTTEGGTNPGPKELITHIHGVCSLIPENDAEEESISLSDGKDFAKKAKDACSSKVQIGNVDEAKKSDSNQSSCTEKVEISGAQKSEGPASPTEKNSIVQKRKKSSSALPVIKSQTSVVRKSSNIKSTDKTSAVNAHNRAARRSSINPASTRNEQQEVRGESQKDKKGSTMSKPSQLDLPSFTENATEEDKENLDFQQMDHTSIQKGSEDLSKGKIGATNDSGYEQD